MENVNLINKTEKSFNEQYTQIKSEYDEHFKEILKKFNNEQFTEIKSEYKGHFKETLKAVKYFCQDIQYKNEPT